MSDIDLTNGMGDAYARRFTLGGAMKKTVLLAVAALFEVAPIALEGVVQKRLRQPSLLAARCQRDRRGSRIEIAKFRRARQVVDAMLLDGGLQRRVKIVAKLITAGAGGTSA